jgi:2-C-methyl-D-erythritol 4-phosphate cytidylyltransferase
VSDDRDVTAQPSARGDVAVVVPAAGAGLRLGPGAPKALRLLDGEPLLVHAVRRIAESPSVAMIVVAAPPADVEAVRTLLAQVTVVAGGATLTSPGVVTEGAAVIPPGVVASGAAAVPPGVVASGAAAVPPGVVAGGAAAVPPGVVAGGAAVIPPGVVAGGAAVIPPGVAAEGATAVPPGLVAGGLATAPVTVVAGGAERQESVAAALAVVPPSLPIVLVHDAARCLTPVSVFERVAAAVRDGADAVIPVLPVVDTIKEVDAEGTVLGTVDRSVLRSVQTPQGFRASVLRAAHAAAADSHTDDAGAVEKIGRQVICVPGSDLALKITRPMDLALATHLLTLPDPDAPQP